MRLNCTQAVAFWPVSVVDHIRDTGLAGTQDLTATGPKASHMDGSAARADASPAEEDARLRADIRLLGRVLGDTVRDQEGPAVFDLVERIRTTSVRFHRDNDDPARRELEAILDGMTLDDTIRIVRAFSYFSHLANIAEDQQNIRRLRDAGAAESLQKAIAQARARGIGADALRRFFNAALVSP